MKLPFFSKRAEPINKFLTVTITSNDVSCLAFYHDEDKYKIIGFGKQELEQDVVRSGVVIESEQVELALYTAVTSALENLEEEILNTIFGVTGDLCLGQMTTVRLKRAERSPITKKELDDLYARINEAALIQAQNDYLETTGNAEAGLENVTVSNVYLKLDNQQVADLEGREGGVIEAAVFNAFSPNFHLTTLQHLTKKTGLKIMAIGSELYALTQWIKKTNRLLMDYIVVDVSWDTTNVAIVFGGGIVATKSLGIGFNHFVKEISEKMGLTINEAKNVLQGYMYGKLTESEGFVVQNCLKDALGIWVLGMEILYKEFTGVKTFPESVYVTGVGADITDVMDTMETEPWTRSIPFKEPPQFTKVNFSNLEIMDATGKILGTEWINTAALSIIYGEIYGKNNG